MALPIYVPIGYIAVLILSLSLFSRIYRKRSALRIATDANQQPWFPDGHPERDIYQTLVGASADAEILAQADAEGKVEDSQDDQQKEPNQENKGKHPTIPEQVLQAALLHRAMADVRRILRMRDDKSAIGTLQQKGSLGDEVTAKFELAEKQLEAEILDVVSEANTFREGWGQIIFPTASEMVAHLKHKEAYYGIAEQRQAESEWNHPNGGAKI